MGDLKPQGRCSVYEIECLVYTPAVSHCPYPEKTYISTLERICYITY